MCRHLAYLGPPVPLGALLLDPPHSLLRQSWAPRDMRGGGTVNADGFGVGWYPEPGGPAGALPPRRADVDRRVVRRGSPAATRSGAVLAAVRSATVGMPVHRDRRGAVRRRAVAVQPQRRGPRLAATRWRRSRPALPVTRPAHPGRADRLGAAVGAGPPPAARPAPTRPTRWPTSCAEVAAAAPGSRLNLLLTDGTRDRGHDAGATRSSSAPTRRGALVASEPLDDDPGWQPVPDRHLVAAEPGRHRCIPLQHRSAAGPPPTRMQRRTRRRPPREPDDRPARRPPHRRRRRRRAARRRARRADRRARSGCRRSGSTTRAAASCSRRSPGCPSTTRPAPSGRSWSAPPTPSPITGRRHARRAGLRLVGEDPAAARRAAARRSRCGATCRWTCASRAAGGDGGARCGVSRPGACTAWSATSPHTWTGCPPDGHRLVAFLGGTIGNLLPPERAEFLHALRASLRAGGAAAARHRPGQRPARAGARLRRRGRGDRRVQPQRAARAQPGAAAPTSTSTRSSTSRCGTPSTSGSRCGCAPGGR